MAPMADEALMLKLHLKLQAFLDDDSTTLACTDRLEDFLDARPPMSPLHDLLCPAEEVEQRLELAAKLVDKVRTAPYALEEDAEKFRNFHLNLIQLSLILVADLDVLKDTLALEQSQFQYEAIEALLAICRPPYDPLRSLLTDILRSSAEGSSKGTQRVL